MHGIIKPVADGGENGAEKYRAVLKDVVRRSRYLLLLVVLPTILVAFYEYLFAADQYQSEAHFIVRSAEQTNAPSTGLGALFGMGAGSSSSRGDAMSVNDYLESTIAVQQLNRSLDLVGRFRRPDADIFSRLGDENPTPEELLKYFRKQSDVHIDVDSGITSLKVRAYRPADAYQILSAMLELGEQRVNFLNRRSLTDTLSSARKQLSEAEDGLASAQSRLTQFRQLRGDLDPEGSGRAQIGVVAQLTTALSQARAKLAAMDGIISPHSPQYVAQAAAARAIEAQVVAQSTGMVQGSRALAARLGDYQDLVIRQEFAAKRYEQAAANLERARLEARKQQLYIVRVVDPNMPVKSLFPQRLRMIATVFFVLLVAYGIGWLITAGVREHAA